MTVYDLDAPTGSGWWHWAVSNIPADVRSLKLNASAGKSPPAGAAESVTDFGTPGYGGVCPPPGDKAHRYIVTIHALETADIGVTPQTLPAMAGFSRCGTVLGSASLTVTYGR
ncbi:YbhB/YbcL family Raf kinase inhibitor-like protein [uncultured Desulfovibrio sp.]|uniref:YbhB/YbcL family Raf kinase inhibitor-like protein n=1 Tax=uncultured Desulfovibrio sp. TaxID=167968 RepID=UPI002633F362|nr:YbhB/YbcL family Raf kinase inhibitor-like protein [uncultured Desulfovibrio sp.]